MTVEIDPYVAVRGIAITAAVLADAIDDAFREGKEDGHNVVLRLTTEQARRIGFFSNEIACTSRRLEREMEQGGGE